MREFFKVHVTTQLRKTKEPTVERPLKKSCYKFYFSKVIEVWLVEQLRLEIALASLSKLAAAKTETEKSHQRIILFSRP